MANPVTFWDSIDLALVTALFTTTLAALGRMLSSAWATHRDRQGVAGALCGEVGAFTRIMIQNDLAKNLRLLMQVDEETRAKRLGASPKLPSNFPVFDAVAGKLGVLPPDLAEDVSAFYNALAGFRVWASQISTADFAASDDLYKASIFEFLARGVERYAGSTALPDRLRFEARKPFILPRCRNSARGLP